MALPLQFGRNAFFDRVAAGGTAPKTNEMGSEGIIIVDTDISFVV